MLIDMELNKKLLMYQNLQLNFLKNIKMHLNLEMFINLLIKKQINQ